MPNNNLKITLENNLCSGCGLCAISSKDMEIDKSGFARPLIPIYDELSAVGCPGYEIKNHNKKNYDDLWGPILTCSTGFASNSVVRKSGSSGGVLSALLIFILESELVDAVIQTRGSIKNPIENETVIVDDINSIIQNSGSRYAPSSPLSVVRSILGNGKKYAFVGKPCDVAALRSLQVMDERIKDQFPILLSFMCAGIPSEHGTHRILKKLGLEVDDIESFRYRGNGWPGLTSAKSKSGQISTMTYNEAWGSILNKSLQRRCKLCADGTGESADIICADGWHESENGYPSFDEADGRSLIIARTENGLDILDQAVIAKSIVIDGAFPPVNISKIQPYQKARKETMLVRVIVANLFYKAPKYIGYRLHILFVKSSPFMQFKAFFGTFIRVVKGRI